MTKESHKDILRDTRERMIRIEEAVIYIKDSISKLPCENRGKRISSLENFKLRLLTIAGIISAFVSLGIKYLWSKLGG